MGSNGSAEYYKQNRLRLTVQAISFAFSNGYVNGWSKGRIYTGPVKKICLPGLNCYSCPGAILSCPIGSLQAVLASGTFRFSLYVMGFIGMIGMFFGRLICGWFCPFGFIQDLLHKIPIFGKRKKRNLPGHRYLKYLKYIILVFFVILLPMFCIRNGAGEPWFCEYICPDGTLLGGIPLTFANPALRTAIGNRFWWKIILTVCIIVLSIIAYRPFCKYVCPLGALYSLCNPVSVYRLKIDNDKCIKCEACQSVCGMEIKVWENPNSLECIRCGKCKAACANGAITSTFEEFQKKLIK